MSDWFASGSGSPVDVAALLDSGELAAGLAEMVQEGALVSMGTTSDGGALSITVTVDGRWRREYVRTDDDVRAWLPGAIDAVRVATAAATASAVPGSRSRRRRGA